MKPTLAGAAKALRIRPDDEAADVADVLDHVDVVHRGAADDPDYYDVEPYEQHWGLCVACGRLWPCEDWVWAQALAVQFLGRAADRIRGGVG